MVKDKPKENGGRIRPAREDEPGWVDQGMICCGKPVAFQPERRSGIVYAVWECPECGQTAAYTLGEPKVEKATILVG